MPLKTVTFEFVWDTDDLPEGDEREGFASLLHSYIEESDDRETARHITVIREDHHWPNNPPHPLNPLALIGHQRLSQLLDTTITLFLEYRDQYGDQYGRSEEEARAAAVAEVLEGYGATTPCPDA